MDNYMCNKKRMMIVKLDDFVAEKKNPQNSKDF